MELGPLLLLLLAAPWGRGWAASGHAPAGEMAPTHGPTVRPGETGKCLETSTTTTSACKPACSSKCPDSSGCGQECQQTKEDFHPPIGRDLTTNYVNKCRDDSNCRGSRKCCRTRCRFRCPQQVPASLDTNLKKKVPHTSGCCNNTCSRDTDCSKHRRCCPPPRRSSRLRIPLALLRLGCQRCSRPTELCCQAPEHGPCMKHMRCFTYIPALRSCQMFVHRGCRGNANNFHTLEESWQVYH